jgi:hypothetical protein
MVIVQHSQLEHGSLSLPSWVDEGVSSAKRPRMA